GIEHDVQGDLSASLACPVVPKVEEARRDQVTPPPHIPLTPKGVVTGDPTPP
ncbi:hypothetical protein HAX54_013504, partial [Datura stramonium]|nr:hypothetical protein [Datura stramonium]